jgi:hypothetical protein
MKTEAPKMLLILLCLNMLITVLLCNLPSRNFHTDFRILKGVFMKNSIFWAITSCSLLRVNRRFGGICYLNLLVTLSTLVSFLAYS